MVHRQTENWNDASTAKELLLNVLLASGVNVYPSLAFVLERDFLSTCC